MSYLGDSLVWVGAFPVLTCRATVVPPYGLGASSFYLCVLPAGLRPRLEQISPCGLFDFEGTCFVPGAKGHDITSKGSPG